MLPIKAKRAGIEPLCIPAALLLADAVEEALGVPVALVEAIITAKSDDDGECAAAVEDGTTVEIDVAALMVEWEIKDTVGVEADSE